MHPTIACLCRVPLASSITALSMNGDTVDLTSKDLYRLPSARFCSRPTVPRVHRTNAFFFKAHFFGNRLKRYVHRYVGGGALTNCSGDVWPTSANCDGPVCSAFIRSGGAIVYRDRPTCGSTPSIHFLRRRPWTSRLVTIVAAAFSPAGAIFFWQQSRPRRSVIQHCTQGALRLVADIRRYRHRPECNRPVRGHRIRGKAATTRF